MRVGSGRNNYGNLPLFLFPVSFCFNSRPLFSSVSNSLPCCLLDVDCKLYMQIHAPPTWFVSLSILFIYSYVVNILLIRLSKIVIIFSELQFGFGWGNTLTADVGAFFGNLPFQQYTQRIMYKSMVQYLKLSFFLWHNTLCSTVYLTVKIIFNDDETSFYLHLRLLNFVNRNTKFHKYSHASNKNIIKYKKL